MIFIAIHNDLQRSSSLKNTVLIAIYKDLQTLTSKKINFSCYLQGFAHFNVKKTWFLLLFARFWRFQLLKNIVLTAIYKDSHPLTSKKFNFDCYLQGFVNFNIWKQYSDCYLQGFGDFSCKKKKKQFWLLFTRVCRLPARKTQSRLGEVLIFAKMGTTLKPNIKI